MSKGRKTLVNSNVLQKVTTPQIAYPGGNKPKDKSVSCSYFLQDSAWANFRNDYGWKSISTTILNKYRVIFYKRKVPGLGFFYYAPRCEDFFGNSVDKNIEIRDAIKDTFKDAFLVFIEPSSQDFKTEKQQSIVNAGFKESPHNIQHQSTIKVDLNRSEEDMLASFSKVARYDKRKAAASGVEIKK